MALKGRLEDLPLLDILQIVAFSQKTGCLRVEAPGVSGAILFEGGKLLAACSSSTLPLLRKLQAAEGGRCREDVLLEQIQIALRELTGLRDGAFRFELTPEVPSAIDGIDVRPFLLREGANPQELLLDLAKELDDERRSTTALLATPAEEARTQATVAPSSPGEEPLEIVLVDDESPVTEVVGAELRAAGYAVATASGPREGFSCVRQAMTAGRRVVVVSDLRMPTTSGRSFLGGLELARMLKKSSLGAPVLLMAEKLSPKVKRWARDLGIRKVAFKPALSKLDPRQYDADLRSFATGLSGQIRSLLDAHPDAHHAPRSAAEEINTAVWNLLKSLTEQLAQPLEAGDISRMVLAVASHYLERAVLFAVKHSEARGLASFGIGDEEEGEDAARRLRIEIPRVQPFAEVLDTRTTLRVSPDLDGLRESLYEKIGRGRAEEVVLLPLLKNRDVFAILYGDNPSSGRPIGPLGGLELFIAQAGLALENFFLHRRLRFFESKLSSEDARTGESL